MDDIAPSTTSVYQSVASLTELGVQHSDGDPDVDVNPHPCTSCVHGHQRELLVHRIEVEIAGILVIVWSCECIAEVKQNKDERYQKCLGIPISLRKLFFKIDLVDDSLQEEDEIIIKLGDKAVNSIMVFAIFEVVEANRS